MTPRLVQNAKKNVIFVAMIMMTAAFLYPLFFMVINSFKTRTQYYTSPFSLPDSHLQLNNYLTMISQFKILNLFCNSFIVSGVSVIFLLFFGIFASYAFAKLQFRGQNFVYMAVIVTLFIPAQVTMIPMYVMFSKIKLVNTYWGVIFAYLAAYLPEVIMLMTSNFKSIPNEMIEAAEIDGCNYFNIVRNVIIPMGRPAIFLTIIFYFIMMWNDLFTPMILLQQMDVRTVMVALASLMSRYDGDPTFQFAGLMLSTIPALLIYMIFQNKIIKGMSAGAIK
jgi:raffinose/stachyose/melibiose transport system permease protein